MFSVVVTVAIRREENRPHHCPVADPIVPHPSREQTEVRGIMAQQATGRCSSSIRAGLTAWCHWMVNHGTDRTVDRQRLGLVVDEYGELQGLVTIDVQQTANDITGSVPIGNGFAPSVRAREANTEVTIADGETVVIGGLIREDETKTLLRFRSPVPPEFVDGVVLE